MTKAMRQEALPASETIDEVAAGVLRMQLPVSLPGLKHVNCYGFVDRRGLAIVDPGMPNPASYQALKKRLAEAGFSIGDVHTVLVTHGHIDHFGLALRVQRKSGARIAVHPHFGIPPDVSGPLGDAHIDGDTVDVSERLRTGGGVVDVPSASPSWRSWEPLERATRWSSDGDRWWNKRRAGVAHWRFESPWNNEFIGPPKAWYLAMSAGAFIAPKRFRIPTPDIALHDGEAIELAGRPWTIVHTPGHTLDHVCLYDEAGEVMLVGDHVLPTITPHVSGMAAIENPLQAYVDSLRHVADIGPDATALPAHGLVFGSLAERCQAIIDHHDERIGKMLGIGAEIGPGTVEQFSQQLFAQRHWGMMAQSETYAHLEHLRCEGLAEVWTERGELVYRLDAAPKEPSLSEATGGLTADREIST